MRYFPFTCIADSRRVSTPVYFGKRGVTVRTSSDVTPGGDHIASFDAEQVEDID